MFVSSFFNLKAGCFLLECNDINSLKPACEETKTLFVEMGFVID